MRATDLGSAFDGPFTIAEAERMGISRSRVRAELSSGALSRVARGVYASAACEDSVDLRIAALSKVVPRDAVVVDRSAAWVWGVDVFPPPTDLDEPPAPEIVLPPGRGRVRRVETVSGERDLRPVDTVRVGALCVTTPVRTCLDLACHLEERAAVAAVEGLSRTQAVTRSDLVRELPRFRGRRGVVQARRVIESMDPGSESMGESLTRSLIIEAGLPRPRTQIIVRSRERLVCRLDMGYEHAKIAVEYDGQQYHSTKAQRRRDERRRAWLADQGWIVIVVTKNDLAQPRREIWLRELRDALRARGALT